MSSDRPAVLPGNIPGLLVEGLHVLHPYSQDGDRPDWSKRSDGFDAGVIYAFDDGAAGDCDVRFINEKGEKLRYDWRFVWLDLSSHAARFRCAAWLNDRRRPAWHHLDGPGRIPEADVAAQVLAADVRRVHAGGGLVLDVLSDWKECGMPGKLLQARWRSNGLPGTLLGPHGWSAGRACGSSEPAEWEGGSGPETGEIGRALAESVAHDAGCWVPGFSENCPERMPVVNHG
jgi:hypothetical protein